MVITWPGNPGSGGGSQPQIPTTFQRKRYRNLGVFQPSPMHPAQPIAAAVGVQDSPIVKGQKPDQVPVNLPAQPKAKTRTPWWEADWAKVASQSKLRAQRLDITRRDLGTGTIKAPAVAEMEYSDVINIDFTQASIQGRVHAVQLSDRPPAPQLVDYIKDGSTDFPAPRLGGSTSSTVQPYVPRNPQDGTQVTPGFTGDPTITHENVLPVIR